jgi:hypothetical protein
MNDIQLMSGSSGGTLEATWEESGGRFWLLR